MDIYGYHYHKESLCQLIQYDIRLNSNRILYTDNELLYRPYVEWPDVRSLTTININTKNSIRYISFELYKMKPNPIDEGDVFTKKVELKID
jgi:hypothetical protein